MSPATVTVKLISSCRKPTTWEGVMGMVMVKVVMVVMVMVKVVMVKVMVMTNDGDGGYSSSLYG